MGDIPALHKHRFPLMIDDAEPAVHLAVRAQAPNLVQLEVRIFHEKSLVLFSS